VVNRNALIEHFRRSEATNFTTFEETGWAPNDRVERTVILFT
jgi:hypothetical protein